MSYEIERKFLVDLEKLGKLENPIAIKQGYIKTQDNTVVRARVKGQKAFLTIKGENQGAKRLEFEYEIPIADANKMISELCSNEYIDKSRYEIKYGNHLWEVDVFYGLNEGLVVAEVELEDENESFELPSWVKEEVTQESKYYNSSLMVNPYTKW